MTEIKNNVLKKGFLKVHYPDHYDLLLDFSREISLGGLSVIVDDFRLQANDFVDVEIYPPNIKKPVRFVARIVGVQNLPTGSEKPLTRVSLYFGSLPAPALAAYEDYLKDLKNQKRAAFHDKNRTPRYHVNLPCMIHVAGSDSEAKIIDISLGGSKIISSELLLDNQKLSCMIFMPDMNRIFIEAELVASTKHDAENFEYRVKFVKFEGSAKIDLGHYLDGLVPDLD